jgi:hypothetical protein
MNILKKYSIQWELGHIATLEYEIRDAKTAMQLAQVRMYINNRYAHLMGDRRMLKLNLKSGRAMHLGEKKQGLLNILKNIKDQFYSQLNKA